MRQCKFKVSIEDCDMRLDNFLHAHLPDLSRASLQKMIKGGQCAINDEPDFLPSRIVRNGQEISLHIPSVSSPLTPVKANIEILWKDKDIVVCNKPAGIAVHPAPSIKEETFIQSVLFHFPQIAAQAGERPGIVHRLDKNTSGILLIALNDTARHALSRAFSNRQIHKTYLAIVEGVPDKTGQCVLPVGRDEKNRTRMAIRPEKKGGRFAHTEWKRLWHFENKISLLEVKIHTGRTHQIRVHLAHLGFPIIGDEVYGNKNSRNMAERQMLHAWKIAFLHPFSSQFMQFSVQPPPDFLNTLLDIKKSTQKIIVTGNAGCGKSTLCRFLAHNNIPVIKADEIVAKLYEPGGEATKWLCYRLGNDILETDGSIDKDRLFQLMNRDVTLRKEVEKIVQSYARLAIERFFELQELSKAPFAAAEIPLFFECGLHEQKNGYIVVGVECEKKIRWERLQKKRSWTQEKIEAIDQWQLSEKEKMSLCDYVIRNDKDEASFENGVKNFLHWLQENDNDAASLLKETFLNIWDADKIRILIKDTPPCEA